MLGHFWIKHHGFEGKNAFLDSPQWKTPIHCCLFHQLRAFQFHLIFCEAWLAKQQPEVGWFTAKHCIFLINRLLGIHTYLFEYIYMYACMHACMYMYNCVYTNITKPKNWGHRTWPHNFLLDLPMYQNDATEEGGQFLSFPTSMDGYPLINIPMANHHL